MRILFVYDNVYMLGGIETWLARMVARLSAEGHEVALLTRRRGEPWDSTSAIADQLAQDATLHFAARQWFKAPRSIQGPLPDADVLFPCNLPALLLAALVQRHRLPEARIVAGVFHPREYCWRAGRLQRRYSQRLTERLLRRLPPENLMFCTDGMRDRTGACLGRDLKRAPVLPIPIDTDRLRPSGDRPIERGKIVSVSRLARYYVHHGHMIRTIRELRDRGHTFTYHIYGDGENRTALEAQARELAVHDAVFFHGAVPYDRLPEVVSKAFAYIGTGTSLLEAAACGIPALVAVYGHPEPLTYGFIHETVGNELGGFAPEHPRYPIADRLLWLGGVSEREYRGVAAAARDRAEEFGISRLLARFLEILDGAVPFSLPISFMDRVLGRLDWWLEAVLLNLGAPDPGIERYAVTRDEVVEGYELEPGTA